MAPDDHAGNRSEAGTAIIDDYACKTRSWDRPARWLEHLGFGGRRAAARRRLCAAISALVLEVNADISRRNGQSNGAASSQEGARANAARTPEQQYVLDMLAQAKEHADKGDAAAMGFGIYKQARRHFRATRLRAASDSDREHELHRQAVVLRARAHDELTGRQQHTVLELLAGQTPEGQVRHPTIEDVDGAQQTFDSRDELIYRRLDMFANALNYLAVALLAVIAVFYVVVANDWLELEKTTVLDDMGGLTAVVAFGVAGALLSATFTTLRSRLPRSRLSQAHFVHLHEHISISLLRPLVGAVAAIALVVIVESGIVASVNVEGSQAYAWAFVAGFSERLLRRTINSIAESAELADNPDGS